MKWAVGVTTVPKRMNDGLLDRTLESLNDTGFIDPVMFVDGEGLATDWAVFRGESVTAYGNFLLGIWELFIRNPSADRFAMFQDDLVASKNLRAYLEAVPYPPSSYLNLYTWPCNANTAGNPNWNPDRTGFILSDQMGRGAVALVFDNATVRTLLSSREMVEHLNDSHRSTRAIDRAVKNALGGAHIREFVHNPSLVQHTGTYSVISKRNNHHPESPIFNGEDFDLLSLLECNGPKSHDS